MTPKEKMLTAYKGGKPDRVLVASEFWYYIPAKVLGVDIAGSLIFSRQLGWDILSFSQLSGSRISLMDVDEERLDLIARLAQNMVENKGTVKNSMKGGKAASYGMSMGTVILILPPVY